MKISGKKDKLVAHAFATIKTNVLPMKTVIEVELDFKKEYENETLTLRISPYSVQMRENTDHKNSEYGHS